MNVINNLLFDFNKHEYMNNEVYITVGFRNGIALRDFAKSNNEKFVCNRAFGNVLFSYLKITDEDFSFSYDVLRTSSIISCQCKTENFAKCIIYIIKRLFYHEYREEVFIKAKEKAKSNFESRYKSEAFRAWYKALEITDSNKGFLLKEFLDDILSLDYETFIRCAKSILIPQNIYIYVNGNIVDFLDDDLELVRNTIPIKDDFIAPTALRFDPYLRQDSHIVVLARENYNLSILYFDFLNLEVENLTKYLILSTLSLALPFDNIEVAVDDFDSSLVFENEYLKPAKDILKSQLDEGGFYAAKNKLLVRYSHLLDKRPIIFGSEVVNLAMSDISYLELLSLIDRCTYDMYDEIYSKAQVKVSEAQIVFRKEM